MSRKIAIIPGTFDPFHLGHKYMVETISGIFDQIIMAITDNKDKSPLLNIDDRVKIIQKTLANFKDKINIIPFTGLLTDLIDKNFTDEEIFIVRGTRTSIEFEQEVKIINGYKLLSTKKIKFLIIPPTTQLQHLSSSIVRNIIKSSESIEKLSNFVDLEAINNILLNIK